MHLFIQVQLPDILFLDIPRDCKQFTGIILVTVQRKPCQRDEIDPVSVFQGVEIIVSGADPHHIGNTRPMSGRSPHPEDVVISPLDIQRMIIHETVHNPVSSRSAVIDIPDHMEMVDGQPLDQMAQGRDQFPDLPGL